MFNEVAHSFVLKVKHFALQRVLFFSFIISFRYTSRFTQAQTAVAQREENVLCEMDFPKVKFPRRNFHGYVKKNKRIRHDSSREVSSMG